MRLTQITIAQLGPFRAPFQMDVDPTVTILTGANDAGKTSVLRALRLLVTNQSASEQDVNRDHLMRAPAAWVKDTGYSLVGEFTIESKDELVGLNRELKGPWTATVRRHPSPQNPVVHYHLRGDGREYQQPDYRIHLPSCVTIGLEPDKDEIRNVIPLDKPNRLESGLLRIAFDAPFNLEKFQQMSEGLWEDSVSHAEQRLNERLQHVVPHSDYFRIRLRAVDGQAQKLSVLVRDMQRGVTPFDYRGAGARKMVQILMRLLTEGGGGAHRLVLIDEPENSLHADAQHLLREFLFDLCADGKTQVIYTTHSSAMINPMRPNQVRLLERRDHKEGASTFLRARPEELGFAAVRSAWGMTLADSLSLSPITVVVEGVTENLCIPLLCQKLEQAAVPGFEDVNKLLGLTGFLDGRGQSLIVVARFAEALGTKVILLVDGDNNSSAVVRQFADTLSTVPVVRLADGCEFEDLVPKARYFEALVDGTGQNGSEWLGEFEAWVELDQSRRRMSFTKRVRKWLEEVKPGHPVPDAKRKPELMAKAIARTLASEIEVEPIRRLTQEIGRHLAGTSFRP